MVDYWKLLKKFFKEHNTKKSLTFEYVSLWYLRENDFSIHPNYLGVWRLSLKDYSIYNKNKKIYYFFWDKILKDFKIKYKGD